MRIAMLLYGVLLCVVGLAGYLGTGGASLTALIPLLFGILVIVLGLIAPRRYKLALALCLLLAAVALAATFTALPGLFTYLVRGVPVPHPAALLARSAMAVLSVVFLLSGIFLAWLKPQA